MAELYANYYAYKTIYKLTDMITKEANEGNFSKLNQAHIITSSIKAICTKDGINGIDILRRAAGGHGYSSYSAIPTLQLELVPTFTFEGKYNCIQVILRFSCCRWPDICLKTTIECIDRAKNPCQKQSPI